jgi:hypothetical protein
VQLEIDGEEVANCLDGQGVRGDLFPTITIGDAPIGGTGRGGGPVPILAQSLEPTQMSSVPIYSLYGRALREQPQLQGTIVVLSTELNDAELERKLIARIRMFRFEAREIEAMTTTKPIEFFPA